MCNVDVEELILAVCLAVLSRCSGPVEDDMATEGLEVLFAFPKKARESVSVGDVVGGDDTSTTTKDLVTGERHHGKVMGRSGDVIICDVKRGRVGDVAAEDVLGKASREAFGNLVYIVAAAARVEVKKRDATVGVGAREFCGGVEVNNFLMLRAIIRDAFRGRQTNHKDLERLV